jgi:hypothetical protein
MKKLLTFIAAFVLSMCLLIFVGCGKTLAVPEKIRIDDDYLMTWSSVENARTYSLEIKSIATGETDTVVSRKTSYSLSSYQEGDYEIRIKAVPRDSSAKESDWSEVVSFHKNYETGCVYTLINNNTEYAITSAGTCTDSFTIEDVYRGKPVTEIANSAFRASKVKNIVVGNNVRSIGDEAFYNCPDLESIVIPQSVTYIGSGAFSSCLSLKEITLPENVDTVEANSFSYCRALEKVVLGDNVTLIGEAAFVGCNSLKSIELPDALLAIYSHAFSECSALESISFGSQLILLDERAFSRCGNLSEIEFAENSSLIRIAAYAFAECPKLTQVALPEGLVSLGIGAFNACTELSEVTMPQSLTTVGSGVFNGTKVYNDCLTAGDNIIYADNWVVAVENRADITELSANDFKEGTVGIVGRAFTSCENLTKVVLPSSIKYLGDSCFAKNKALYSVTLPGVETIAYGVFTDCDNLMILNLGENLKSIGTNAFYGCDKLANPENGNLIPASVTSIREKAFVNTALWNNPTEEGVVYAGNWVVGYNTVDAEGKEINITTVTLKPDTIGIADFAFLGCESLKNVRGAITDVRYLGTGAFYNCTGLSAISLNENLQEIKDYTFYKCESLYSIDIPANLKKIGRSAFYDCHTLSEIDLSSGRVEEIGYFAFFRCKNIKTIDFGDYLKEVSAYAFLNCISLSEVYLPSSVVSIGALAFQDCIALKKVGFVEGAVPNLTTIGQYAFARCANLKTFEFPSSLRVIGDYAFSDCASLRRAEFADGIEQIGKFAFYANRNLTRLYLPSSLKTIGEQAFRSCTGLLSVLLPSTLENVGAHAFYRCTQLTVYSDAQSVPESWDTRWNSSFRPVMLGCTLSEDGSYVVSVTINESLMLNVERLSESGDSAPVLGNNRFSSPSRRGYNFSGWTTQADGTTPELTGSDIADLPEGTVLYTVWEVETEEPEDEEPGEGEIDRSLSDVPSLWS